MGENVKWERTPEDWIAAVKRAMFIAMSAWMEIAVQVAREWAPVRSGRLVREIKPDPETPVFSGPLEILGRIGVSGLAYARAHELGSGLYGPSHAKYPIAARYAKALAFSWPNAPEAVQLAQPQGAKPGGVYFFTAVQHPGVPPSKGRGYLRPGIHDTRADGGRLLMAALKAELAMEL